jgi:hypothetical protein
MGTGRWIAFCGRSKNEGWEPEIVRFLEDRPLLWATPAERWRCDLSPLTLWIPSVSER